MAKGILMSGGGGAASDACGSETQFVYVDSTNEEITKTTTTVGGPSDGNYPIYMNKGVMTKLTGTLANNISGNAATASKFSNVSAGNATKPIYFSGGSPVECTPYSSASVNYANSSGQADNATKVSGGSAAAGSTFTVLDCTMASNDGFRILVGGDSDAGYVEFATRDNGNDPIFVRQYGSTGVTHSITLMDANGYSTFIRAYNAVWNDYAEYILGEGEPGQVVCQDKFGIAKPSTKRLQKCPNVVSDTYGYALGNKENSVPVAVAGRVLVKSTEILKVGDVVCAGACGTASKMNTLEKILFPDRILGVVVEIPTYKTWGPEDDSIEVNNRVWIKVR